MKIMHLKANYCYPSKHWKVFTKTLSLMKFMAIFIFIAGLHVSAKANTQITLSEHNVQLQKVFKQIQLQTGYDFRYNVELLQQAGKISIDVKNVSLEKAMEQSLKDKSLGNSVVQKTIDIKPIETNSFKTVNRLSLPPSEIKGKVVDEKGVAMIGVTVSVKGGKEVTITNEKGEFRLTNTDQNATLLFTAINIEPFELNVNGRTSIIVNVKTKITIVDEVIINSVNTGYQTISKERSAGAFAKPNLEILQDRASSVNILPRLEGLIPGFTVNFAQGNPATGTNRLTSGEGKSNQFIIRGIGSVQAERAPLYVVNGIILDDLNSLNANDVEDVTVLKDATASSIWGSRAANGVVIITTKKGSRNQKIKVQYDAFYNMMGIPDYNYFPRMSSAEFIKTAREVFDPVVNTWPNVSTFTTSTSGAGLPPHEMILYNQFRGLISATRANAQLDSLSAINNNQQIGDYFYRNQSLLNQTISLSGGGNAHSFYGSFSYINNQSYTPGEQNNQYTLNLRQDFRLNNRINFYLITDLSNNITSTKRSISVDNRFLPYQLFKDGNGRNTDLSYLSYITTDSVKNAFESQSQINLNYSPIDEFDRGQTNSNGLNARITAGVSLKLYKGVKFEGTYGYTRGANKTTNFDNENSFLVRNQLVQFTQAPVAPSTTPTYFFPRTGGQFSTNDLLQKRWTIRNQLSFDTSLNKGKHQITFLLGQEAQENFSNTSNSITRGFDPLLLTYQNIDYNLLSVTGVTNAVATTGSGKISRFTSPIFSISENLTRVTSYYSNVGYTLNSKYTLNGSWRIDESNLFGVDKSAQKKPVWSVGTKWSIGNEAFMKNIEWLNYLALRATYGITGNAPSPGSATSFDVLNSANSTFAPGPGLRILTYANKALTWERTENLNLGIDFKFLNRRIYGSLDYYERKTTDLIGQVPVNLIAGASSIVGNFGDMDNKGIELSLSSLNISSQKFSWTTTLNLSHNVNTITKLRQITPISDLQRLVQQTKYYEGYPALSIFAYNWAGLDNLGDPQIFLPDGSKYKSASATALSIDGARSMGTFQPIWNGALLNFITFKNFSLSSSIIFNMGHVGRRDVTQELNGGRFNTNRLTFSQGSYPQLQVGNVHSDLLSRWKKQGDEFITDVPVYLTTNTNRRNIAYYYFGSNNVYNASYAKLRDITFSYGLPQSVLRKFRINEMRFRIQSSNLMLWRANAYDLDPEFQITDINYTIDRTMPVGQGAVTIGLNVKF